MEIQKSDNIEHWVHSLDKEVTTLGHAQAGITSKLEAHEDQLDRIESGLGKLVEFISTPKPPMNLIGAIAGIATIVLAFGLFFELRIAPSEQLNTFMYENLIDINDELGVRGAQLANHEARLAAREAAFQHLDMQHHATQRAVHALQISVGGLNAINEHNKAEAITSAIKDIE